MPLEKNRQTPELSLRVKTAKFYTEAKKYNQHSVLKSLKIKVKVSGSISLISFQYEIQEAPKRSNNNIKQALPYQLSFILWLSFSR